MAIAPSNHVVEPAGGPAIHAVGGVGSIRLAWRELPDVTAYRVHGRPADEFSSHPDATKLLATNLLATVDEPRFVHEGLGPISTQWVYAVQPLGSDHDDRPLTLTAASQTSVTRTGVPVATVGEFDGSDRGLALAPTGFALYRSKFPRDVDFRFGYDKPETTWSYLHPGPDDAWAGRCAHRFRLRFDLDRCPDADLDLAIWLVDRHPAHAGSATIAVNGAPTERVFFDDPLAVGESVTVGAPMRGAGPAYIERAVDRGRLRAGENTIDLIKDHGSWIAYDAVGVFARRP